MVYENVVMVTVIPPLHHVFISLNSYQKPLIFSTKDEDKDGKKKKRKRGKCIDTIIDGSMMGAVLAGCLAMVLGASFFAYKNLYYAVMKKWYPDTYKN